MDNTKLLKLAPTLVMVAALTYLVSSAQPDLPPAAEEGRAGAGKAGPSPSTAAATKAAGSRDPFQVVVKPAEGAAAKKVEAVAKQSGPDPWDEVIRGLTLDATFVQGRDQIAIIGGRFYRKGQHLRLDGDDGGEPGGRFSRLFVAEVQPMKVVLRAGGGRTYELGYPDQLGRPAAGRRGGRDADAGAEFDPGGQMAMSQALLNSPLGALGKALLGNAAPGPPPSSSRRRGPRSSGAATP
jgi:hypothetical protein